MIQPVASHPYRGRLAPSPTGLLHLGHAKTFWTAQSRARSAGGQLILRNDDLDASRVRRDFITAFLDDLRWFGFTWVEGPDMGGPFAPYNQSERLTIYREAFDQLRASGAIYPCTCSRQDILRSIAAPHHGEEEPVYPGTCRNRNIDDVPPGARVSWRFRVQDGEVIAFQDGGFGPQQFTAGRDFGDFVIRRHDHLPSYQLACAVDDSSMQIAEVVRGADLLLSTARQLLILRALGRQPPDYFHSPLVLDDRGERLAKRHDSLSLRSLRDSGLRPEEIRAKWF